MSENRDILLCSHIQSTIKIFPVVAEACEYFEKNISQQPFVHNFLLQTNVYLFEKFNKLDVYEKNIVFLKLIPNLMI